MTSTVAPKDMKTTSEDAETRRHRIGIGEHLVATEPTVIATSGLGSCVGVGLYDENGRGGLAHCMLPSAGEAGDENPEKPGKYVDTGIETLHTKLVDAGTDPRNLRAKVAGGSDMLGLSDGPAVGERNVVAARTVLEQRNIPIVAADTGGEQGRSLSFETATAKLHIAAADGSTTVL
jgi:chemotaxis protein CheD